MSGGNMQGNLISRAKSGAGYLGLKWLSSRAGLGPTGKLRVSFRPRRFHLHALYLNGIS